MPKSHNLSKAIDKSKGILPIGTEKASGVGFMNSDDDGYNVTKNRLIMPPSTTPEAQQWEGWGSALKPGYEPIVLARKSFSGSLTANVLKHGVGGLNVARCGNGRHPANLLLDEQVATALGDQARYFYCAKPSKSERHAAGLNAHPTVKPIALMRWLIELVCPPEGILIDPFLGSGTTLLAAMETDCDALGIECDPEYVQIAQGRVEHALNEKGQP